MTPAANISIYGWAAVLSAAATILTFVSGILFFSGAKWIGIAAGIGYLLIVGGFIKGGQRDPIFYGGSFLLGICYPVWGFWLGKIILESLLQ